MGLFYKLAPTRLGLACKTDPCVGHSISTIFHSMASKLKFSSRNHYPGLIMVPCALVLCMVPFQMVLAHGVLLESSPTHGSVLQASPNQVVLHFNATLEPSITQVNLVDLQEVCTPPQTCLLYTSPSPRDRTRSRMPSSA